MNFTSLHHIAVICSDYSQAIHFYRDILGFKVLKDTERPEKNDRKIDLLMDSHTELELFIKAGAPKRPSFPEAYGLRHLAFRVQSADETAAWLQRQGVTVEPVRTDDITGERMTFFFDPGGLPLELLD
ncbi:MAG: VOC family protein [Oscillospiraceae bacterium]